MLKLLKKIPGFSDLNKETLLMVQEILQPVTFGKGELFCAQVCDKTYP